MGAEEPAAEPEVEAPPPRPPGRQPPAADGPAGPALGRGARPSGRSTPPPPTENGYFLLDLGESWTPYLFTERDSENEERIPHAYRETYLALARGEFPDDHHGARAERDKYLELYGIMPTLGLLRRRFREVRDLECRQELDLAPLAAFDGFEAYRNNTVARRRASQFRHLERQVNGLVERQGVSSEAELDEDRLDDREQRDAARVPRPAPARWKPSAPPRRASSARATSRARARTSTAPWTGSTHEALAEFERRHRVYGWGFIGGETLERLREPPLELERRAVVRVLTERAMHSLGRPRGRLGADAGRGRSPAPSRAWTAGARGAEPRGGAADAHRRGARPEHAGGRRSTSWKGSAT